MRILIALLGAALILDVSHVLAAESQLLWPNGAPLAKGEKPEDQPRVTPYPAPADKNVHAAVVVCPGGGYGALAMGHEGREIADWFNQRGITAFVLEYRLGSKGYRHPAMMLDAQRAMRFARSKAKELDFDPNKLGLIGFSAGGHLASTAGTHFDDGMKDAKDDIDMLSCRPDFLILCYPVVTLGEFTHQGSKNNLLGKEPSAEVVESLSNETQVTDKTPPTFLFHTSQDTVVLPENSILFYSALRKNKVPAELHIYEKGGHGVGLGKGDPTLATWPGRLEDWLKVRGVLK